MNEWETLKVAYLKDHYAKPLKQTSRRESALGNVEGWLKALASFNTNEANAFFSKVDRPALIRLLEDKKGKPLNDAEKSVVTGLYKFSGAL